MIAWRKADAGDVLYSAWMWGRIQRLLRHLIEIVQCQRGLRDGLPGWGQFCIDKVLGYAVAGDVRKGLFFRGAGPLPFGAEIRPVRDLMAWLVGGTVPPAPARAPKAA